MKASMGFHGLGLKPMFSESEDRSGLLGEQPYRGHFQRILAYLYQTKPRVRRDLAEASIVWSKPRPLAAPWLRIGVWLRI